MHRCSAQLIKQILIWIPFTILILTVAALKIKFITSDASLISNKTIILSPSHGKRFQCIVYTKYLAGRLGNRMFLIASAYGLARLHSCRLYLPAQVIKEVSSLFTFDLSPFLITLNSTIHNASNPMTTKSKYVICNYIVESTCPNALSPGSMFELRGYWQSYLHFAKYGNDIRWRLFAGKTSILEKVSKFFIGIYQQKFNFKPQFSIEDHQSFKTQLIQLNWTTSIGVHVRRKDIVSIRFASSDQYLFSAIQYYTKRYPNAHFLISSDDKLYCKNIFRNYTNIFVTPQLFSDADGLITLSLCEHSIVAGETFGWWAVYLANGQVIRDAGYLSGYKRRKHYYPPWFLIDGNVRMLENSEYTLRYKDNKGKRNILHHMKEIIRIWYRFFHCVCGSLEFIIP